MDTQYVTLTRELIHAGRTGTGGWNRRQLAAIGVAWSDVRSGWIDRAAGRRVPADAYRLFLELKGQTESRRRQSHACPQVSMCVHCRSRSPAAP